MNRQAMIVLGSLAGGLVLLAWLGWQFVLNPVSKDIRARQDKLKANTEELETVRGKKAQYDKFMREAETARHEVQLLRQRLDAVLPAGELVRIVNGQAQAFNPRDFSCEYSKRDVSKWADVKGLDEIAFKMKFKSDYETVGKLLNGMVSQLRMISPEKVTLTSYDDHEEGRLTVDAVIEFKMFLESPKGGT